MFKLLKIENARMNVPEPVFHEATANEAISIGEALVLSSGKLTICPTTTKPEFIAIGQLGASDANRKVAVCRVESNQVYEVPVTVAPTGLKVGDKVAIHTDGLQITEDTTNGVITIENLNGAEAAGDTIVVRI